MVIKVSNRIRFRNVALFIAATSAILTAPTWLRWFGIIGAIPRGMMWGGYEGIYVAENGPPVVYPLRTKAAKYMYSPVFAIWRHGVVYWSRRDAAIRLVPADGPPRWIQMDHRLPSGADVWEITPSPTGVVVNADDASYRIALPAGTVSLIPDARRAKSSEKSADLVVVNNMGNLELRHGSGRKVILKPRGRLGMWDYDFTRRRLCFVDGMSITMTGDGRSSVWHIWPLGLEEPNAVSVVPSAQQVWVVGAGALGSGNELLLYDYNGHLVATQVDAQDVTAGLPVGLVDDRTVNTLKRLGRIAPGEQGVE